VGPIASFSARAGRASRQVLGEDASENQRETPGEELVGDCGEGATSCGTRGRIGASSCGVGCTACRGAPTKTPCRSRASGIRGHG